MQKHKRIVVANWKMNPDTLEEARKMFADIKRASATLRKTVTVVCPTFIHLPQFAKLATPKTRVGAQDLFWEPRGSYTGEVSAPALRAIGATHVIIGHAERRELGDTNEIVAKKVGAALREGLVAILCIGEKHRDAQGEYLSFLRDQLLASLASVQKKHFDQLIVAYEPIWAIGKTEALNGAGMYQIVILIRKILNDAFGPDYAAHMPVLYGGSVTPANTTDIIREGHVDGLLVGRQSLDPKQFADILHIVDGI